MDPRIVRAYAELTSAEVERSAAADTQMTEANIAQIVGILLDLIAGAPVALLNKMCRTGQGIIFRGATLCADNGVFVWCEQTCGDVVIAVGSAPTILIGDAVRSMLARGETVGTVIDAWAMWTQYIADLKEED